MNIIERIRIAKQNLMTWGLYLDGAGNEIKSTVFEDAAYEIERLRAENARIKAENRDLRSQLRTDPWNQNFHDGEESQ